MVLIVQNLFQEPNMKKNGSDLEKKIVMWTKKYLILVAWLKTDFNVKITKVKSKIPSISGLATTSALTALTAVENKISNVSGLVAKTDFDAKLKKLVTELLQIQHSICLLKMN